MYINTETIVIEVSVYMRKFRNTLNRLGGKHQKYLFIVQYDSLPTADLN